LLASRDATWWLIGSFILHPAVLLCTDGEGPSCLTASQVAAVKQIYSPAISPRTRTELFSSLVPGTELGWSVLAGGPNPFMTAADQFKYVVYKDPNWDWRNLNIERDVVLADEPSPGAPDALEPSRIPPKCVRSRAGIRDGRDLDRLLVEERPRLARPTSGRAGHGEVPSRDSAPRRNSR